MQKRGFIYWLFSKSMKVLYVDDSGIIQEAVDNSIHNDTFTLLKPDGTPAHLKFSPDGWKDVLLKYGRNIKYMGLFRDFTVPMKFKKDGGHIVKDQMWNQGIEAVTYLGISKLNRTTFPDKYETWYLGELDYSKFVQKKTDVTLNVMEGGLSKYLKAYENTVYEIPVDADLQAVKVLLDGFPFTNKINYIMIDSAYPNYAPSYQRFWYLGLAIISEEGSTQGVLIQEQQPEAISSQPNDKWFLYSETKTFNLNITLSFNVTVYVTPSPHTIRIYVETANNGVVTAGVFLHNASHSNGDVFTVNYTGIISVVPGDKLYVIVDVDYDNAHIGDAYFLRFAVTNGTMNTNYEVTFDSTITKAMRPLRLLQKIVGLMTGNRYTASSTFLAGMNDYVVTSGQAIRNHEGDASATVHGSVIKTSLSEFFQSFKRFRIGLGIENNILVIEQLDYFFKPTTTLELGITDDLQITVAEDLMFNTVKVGQANQTYDEVNGKDEFNVTESYQTPITRVVRELDLTSPYRADMYGVELTRLNLSGKDTTDNKADNDTFLLNIETTLSSFGGFGVIKYYNLNRPAYVITGLLHPAKAFNINLSPKRALINNGSYLHSVLDKLDMYYMKFTSGDKNSEMVTTLAGEVITEKADCQIADLAAKLFLPYYFTFTTSVPLNYPILMKTNPYGMISFESEGETYYGYMWDGGIAPAKNDKQQFKLLAAPNSNMAKLINAL